MIGNTVRFFSAVLLVVGAFTSIAFAQNAQLRGTVQDPQNATIPGASVTLTNQATQVADKATTDESGRYLFNNLRPATYTLQVEASGFKTASRADVTLRVGQQSDLDFVLEVGSVTTNVEVTTAAPLLNTVSGALGQEVDNRHITEVPLLDRAILNLAFLAPGITEVGGGLFGNSAQLTGVNFSSNGQRLSTTEVRLDGNLISGPETGEGGMFTVSYQPPIEVVQEFKVQNNSFSAEYGNNGGTTISIVTNSGTNSLHGSGYWFGRRPQFDANDFYSNRAGQPKADFVHDQYGGSVGGPIVIPRVYNGKNRSFFFFDYERIRDSSPTTVTTTVPTDLQRTGDFSQTFNPDGSLVKIFNPFSTYTDASGNILRQPFVGNIIPASMISPLSSKIMTFFPEATGPGDPVTGLNNFTRNGTTNNPAYSFDIKGDQYLSKNSRMAVRYSRYHQTQEGAIIYKNAADPNASFQTTDVHNGVVEHTWSINPSTVWVNRVGLERYKSPRHSPNFDATSIGFPSILQAGGATIFPRLEFDGGYAGLGTFGWTDTIAARTQSLFNSSLSKVMGPHNLKFGGEERIILTNFYQPGFPGGYFQFSRNATNENVFSPDPTQGNSLAGLLLDFGDPGTWGGLNIQPGTATKSKETAFYAQDDWRVTQKLTLNLGLRYEWSTPYTERYNRIQIADATADTGIDVPGLGQIHGVNRFVTAKDRTISPDRNNFAPRIGLAYRLGANTVLRAGAGVYYGVNPITNSWLTGSAFRKYASWHSTLDGGVTRYATLENPFPSGVVLPQNAKYGNVNMWGFSDDSVMSPTFRNAEIYQWSASVQHEFRGNWMVEVAYSANRSTHLPFGGTENLNIIRPEVAQQWGNQHLNDQVANPFQPFFQGANRVFNEPDSIYNNPTIPRINLLVPFPQFAGAFQGGKKYVAYSRYNALQLRVEKRYSHGLSLIGSYTYSRLYDDSSVGNNSWLGNNAGIQNPYDLRGEYSVGGSDTPNRIVGSVIYELPIGRGKPLGHSMNRVVNGIVGGWQVSTFFSYQSGNPLNIGMAAGILAYGSQRPNVSGNPRGADIRTVVDGKGNYFNASAFSAPPEEVPGNEKRFDERLRGDTIHNIDFTLSKNFQISEKMRLQVRADSFNTTNTVRFGFPNTAFGDGGFGTINSQINYPRRVQMGARFSF